MTETIHTRRLDGTPSCVGPVARVVFGNNDIVAPNTVLKYSTTVGTTLKGSPNVPAMLPQVLHDVRRTEIVKRVMADPRTRGDMLLGVDRHSALEAINWGQADFDEPSGALSAEDRVLLYAYLNQLGHLEELSEAFRQMFSTSRPDTPLIVIDLGCGPFTGGLALAGQLGPSERFDYIGVDRAQAMRRFGEQLARAAESLPETPRMDRQWASDIASVDWDQPPSWRPVLVVVSFLLASPTLQIVTLLNDLDRLLSKLGRGEVNILYTNSPKAGPNRRFPVFRKALTDAGFEPSVDDTGQVQTKRTSRKVRYALFHRDQQRTLRLTGD